MQCMFYRCERTRNKNWGHLACWGKAWSQAKNRFQSQQNVFHAIKNQTLYRPFLDYFSGKPRRSSAGTSAEAKHEARPLQARNPSAQGAALQADEFFPLRADPCCAGMEKGGARRADRFQNQASAARMGVKPALRQASVGAWSHPGMFDDSDHIEKGGNQPVDFGKLDKTVFSLPGGYPVQQHAGCGKIDPDQLGA